MSFHTSTLPDLKDDDVNILLLDLEGVMTKGMLGAAPHLGNLFYFHMQGECDGVYSADATRHVETLVNQYNFRIVLITRHGKNEGHILQKRLDNAGIQKDWLYARDPDAIGEHHKDDGIRDWMARNPQIPMSRIVCIEDHPENITIIPPERVVGTNSDHGLVYRDYKRVLTIMGMVPLRPVSAATRRQGPQAPSA